MSELIEKRDAYHIIKDMVGLVRRDVLMDAYDAIKNLPTIDAVPVPHWVKVDENNPGDRWFVEAYKNSRADQNWSNANGTYEAIGPHFQGNPYGLHFDVLYKHGSQIVDVPRSFEGIKQYLFSHNIEGIVFWKDGEPQCKIKRSDFGFKWPKEDA